MIAALPVGSPIRWSVPPASREHLGDLKASHEVDASTADELAGWTPPALHALALRSVTVAMRRLPQRSVHTVTTNVPVPSSRCTRLGREMLEYLPYVPLSRRADRCRHPVLQRAAALRVTGDYDTVPETEWFATRIEAAVAELVGCAELVTGATTRRARPACPDAAEHTAGVSCST